MLKMSKRTRDLYKREPFTFAKMSFLCPEGLYVTRRVIYSGANRLYLKAMRVHFYCKRGLLLDSSSKINIHVGTNMIFDSCNKSKLLRAGVQFL